MPAVTSFSSIFKRIDLHRHALYLDSIKMRTFFAGRRLLFCAFNNVVQSVKVKVAFSRITAMLKYATECRPKFVTLVSMVEFVCHILMATNFHFTVRTSPIQVGIKSPIISPIIFISRQSPIVFLELPRNATDD